MARPIGELLDALLSACRMPVRVEVDPARYRPVDRPATVGSYAALQEATGWEPAIPLTRTVLDTLAYWRAQR
jgi:GDP-4-dehydro-6-deoxy-D-mannose reductase